MSRKMMLVTFMVLPFLAARPVLAQDTLKLDLGKALEIALSENPTVKVADKEIRFSISSDQFCGGLQPYLEETGDVYGFRHG